MFTKIYNMIHIIAPLILIQPRFFFPRHTVLDTVSIPVFAHFNLAYPCFLCSKFPVLITTIGDAIEKFGVFPKDFNNIFALIAY